MVPFLKNFLGNLNAIQSKQVLRILTQMRDKGEIRSTKDFERNLVDLSNFIQKDQLTQRTPPLAFSEGETLESDAIRTWVEYVRMDLEAALGETDRLSNSMRAHNRILVENYFDSIESAVSELEAETRAYEILENQKFKGFLSNLKQYIFDGATNTPGADKDDAFVSSLFVDGRGEQALAYSPPDNSGGGIHLGLRRSKNEYEHRFSRVEIITDSTTPQTALNTSTEDNIPIHAIDGSLDTAWKHSVLLTEDPDFCRLIFAPSFTGARRVNSLLIHPLSDVSMKIVSISYIDSGGKQIDLPIGTNYIGVSNGLSVRSGPLGDQLLREEDCILPNKRKLISVGDIVARRFIITLQQDTGGEGDFFYYDNNLGNWAKNTSPEDLIEGLMRERNASESEILSEFGFLDELHEGRRQARFRDYVFGFKEISALEREYETSGLFVPEPLDKTKKAPSVLGLYSDADFPVGELTDIEFLLRKENYLSGGSLLDVETIPMIPYGSSSVTERFFLSELQVDLTVKDAGRLRFYPDFSETFEIYRDGSVLLTIGSDYEVSVDGGTTFETSLPPTATSSNPKVCIIRIVSPEAGSIYTVSYSPLVSTSEVGGEVWLNVDQTVRLGRDQTYVFENNRAAGKVAWSKLGLQIIVRANTLNTRISPYLREVILLGGLDG